MCFDFEDVPGGSEYGGYYLREEGRVGHRVIRDTESISASYDRYLRDGVWLKDACPFLFG